jgi:hypothetical protein
VIDVLLWVIVPELTVFAVVLGHLLAAFNAFLSSRLHLEAMHAHHCGNKVSIGEIRYINVNEFSKKNPPRDRMIRLLVVAKSARIPLSATMRLELSRPLIVLTSQVS